MKSLKQLIEARQNPDKNKYVSREYQDYGYRLAVELNDLSHKALYIKLAKNTERATMEQCRQFVIDSHADNRGALFMWKLKQLKTNNEKKAA
jgi:hypothetical protein